MCCVSNNRNTSRDLKDRVVYFIILNLVGDIEELFTLLIIHVPTKSDVKI